MFLGGNLRFTRLILLFSLAVPFYVNAEVWNDIGYIYSYSSIAGNQDVEDGKSFKCSISGFPQTAKDGNPNAPRDDTFVDYGNDYIKVQYGERFRSGSIGFFRYAELFTFDNNLPGQMGKVIGEALKKALKSGNCTLADELANQLKNGELKPCGNDKCVGFEDDNGSRCAISSTGESKCKWDAGTANGTNEDGTPKITISPREGTLEDYAGVEEKDKVDENNPPNPGETKPDNSSNPSNAGSSGNSDGVNEHRGKTGQSNIGRGDGAGSGTVDGNTAGSMGDASRGSGDGKGSLAGTGGNGNGNKKGEGTGIGGGGKGNGKGDGDGDEDKGDGEKGPDMPKLEEFDIVKALSFLKDNLTEKLALDALSMPGGSCPSFNVAVFGRSQFITIHCDILDKHGDAISAAFLFIWGFMAIRIFLSA